jgi:hypothetical protein
MYILMTSFKNDWQCVLVSDVNTSPSYHGSWFSVPYILFPMHLINDFDSWSLESHSKNMIGIVTLSLVGIHHLRIMIWKCHFSSFFFKYIEWLILLYNRIEQVSKAMLGYIWNVYRLNVYDTWRAFQCHFKGTLVSTHVRREWFWCMHILMALQKHVWHCVLVFGANRMPLYHGRSSRVITFFFQIHLMIDFSLESERARHKSCVWIFFEFLLIKFVWHLESFSVPF